MSYVAYCAPSRSSVARSRTGAASAGAPASYWSKRYCTQRAAPWWAWPSQKGSPAAQTSVSMSVSDSVPRKATMRCDERWSTSST
ncbi:hypothetical protein STCU_11629 [Strigomonas culicis]|uniref:Uncharacterized protein n=1 Tax=Strigomonas culicis TaxID=28005 RepID=S9UZK9_9TRYP|nr:hypothetical protein STCU_11629 [Strigomonas culicis]|eukprot:EPY15980.1 hypothetical protein STCU_11629 [Strigomonas culicis]